MSSRRVRVLGGAVVLSALAIFVGFRLEVSTGLVPFLEGQTERDLATISRQLMDSRATRTMILSIEGRDRNTALDAAGELASRLASHTEVRSVRSGPP